MSHWDRQTSNFWCGCSRLRLWMMESSRSATGAAKAPVAVVPVGPRREAVRMIVRWEHRVAEALVSQRRATFEARLAPGVLVARTGLAR
jgi:hypothetical protein